MSAGDRFKLNESGPLLPPRPAHAGYFNALRASFGHAVALQLRRQRVLLAGGITLLPVVIPLALAFLSTSQFADDGNVIFVRLCEDVLIDVMAPLLALFFATMLIGEEAETQTLPFMLTRPMPRSAWVLGRYGGFLAVAGTILAVSMGFIFAACTALSGLHFDGEGLTKLAHYAGVALAGMAAYGALTMFLGAYFKRPIVIGVLLLYGWQGLAMTVPGVVDFLTIRKYTEALLPRLAESRNVEVRTALLTYNKEIFMVDARNAALILAAVVVAALAVSIYTVRRREYASARSAGG